MLLKCCTQYASKFGALSNDHRIEKCPFSVWLQRKAVPKNVQTTILIVLISHASKFTLNFFKLGPSTTWTKNIQMFKLVLEKAEEPEIKLPTFAGSSKKQEFQKNVYFCVIDYNKAFDCVDHNKMWKIHQEVGIPDYLTCLLRNLYADQEATIRTGHGQQTCSK